MTIDPPDLIQFNRDRLSAQVDSGIEFSRIFLDLDEATAREFVEPHNVMGGVTGKVELCLDAGSGQQSAVFGVLGSDVTIYALTSAMCDRIAKRTSPDICGHL